MPYSISEWQRLADEYQRIADERHHSPHPWPKGVEWAWVLTLLVIAAVWIGSGWLLWATI